MKQIIPNTTILMLVVISCWSCTGARGDIVVPAGLETTEGDAALAAPFNAPIAVRSQSLYDASNFSGPTTISQIAYRLDVASNDIDFTISDMQVNFSTFTGSSLDVTFANNVGSDDAIVFNRGSQPVVMSSGNSPNAFDLVINLNNRFTYDPADGDLLVDIRKFSLEFAPMNFDAQTTLDTTTVFSEVSDAAGISLEGVLVARLTVVPEPGATAFLLGLCLMGLSVRSRRRSI